jgi:hypothetical protein
MSEAASVGKIYSLLTIVLASAPPLSGKSMSTKEIKANWME